MGNCCAADVDEDVPQTSMLASDWDRFSKLNPVKVNQMWEKKREASDPARDRIRNIMNNCDRDNDGFLDRREAVNICRRFLEKSEEGSADDYTEEDIDRVFAQLDANEDGRIDVSEVETACKAMWLMAKDDVKLSELTGQYVGSTIQDLSPAVDGGEPNGEPSPFPQPTEEELRLPKLSARKVESVWKLKRNSQEGPDERAVQHAMEKSRNHKANKSAGKAIERSDNNADGFLTKKEATRISKAFMKKAGLSISEADVFEYLDTNQDGKLDKQEVALAMKAMWLMDGDGVKINDLLEH